MINGASRPTATLSTRSCARCGDIFPTSAKHYVCPACRTPRDRDISCTTALSRREQQIVALIQQAKSNKQIAFELHLTEGTIKEYLYRIFRKLHVSSRTELALRSYCEGRLENIPGTTGLPIVMDRLQ